MSNAAILLLVEDRSVLSALRFSLTVEGFEIADGTASPVAALIVDECYGGDGLAVLAALRKQGRAAPAIVLATNPPARLRARIAAMNAELIEKPLLGDELSRAIRAAIEMREAA